MASRRIFGAFRRCRTGQSVRRRACLITIFSVGSSLGSTSHSVRAMCPSKSRNPKGATHAEGSETWPAY
jgi:hypothetical protein